MIRVLRHPPAWLAWLLLAVAVLGLLLPWLLAPISSDERYHYPAAPGRMADNVLNVLPWAIDDIGWRMREGRIAPLGVFVQHVFYLLGMQFAFSSGVPLVVVHGLVKAFLLVAAIGSFALLVGQLRRRDGAPLDRGARILAVVLFAAFLILGVTASLPLRNGWMTFVVLCIGGITVMFLTGAISLWALHGWDRWGRTRRSASVIGLILLGVAVLLSYEMHWAAVPFAMVLLASIGPARVAQRVALGGALGLGWLVAVLGSRRLIAAAAEGDVYAGLSPELGGPVLRVVGLQLVNAVPGSGIGYTLQTVGPGLPEPEPFDGMGWMWGLLFAAGLVILLRRLLGSEPVESRPDSQPLVVVGVALGVSALAAAVILSISAQSHTIVRHIGATYRGTPWIWGCIAGILGVMLLVLARRSRLGRVALVAIPGVCAIAVGVFVWPSTVSSIQTFRASDSNLIFDQAQAELVTGSQDPFAVAHRCQLADHAMEWAGDNVYRQNHIRLYDSSFTNQWGKPWCP